MVIRLAFFKHFARKNYELTDYRVGGQSVQRSKEVMRKWVSIKIHLKCYPLVKLYGPVTEFYRKICTLK